MLEHFFVINITYYDFIKNCKDLKLIQNELYNIKKENGF